MNQFEIKSCDDGKRIDRMLKEVFPKLSVNSLYKCFRKKDVKVNGERVKENYLVKKNDLIQVYLLDDILFGLNDVDYKRKYFSIVYEDNNLIVVNKKQGVSVHPDKIDEDNTLIDVVKKYLLNKGEDISQVALCHRIDRNTGGLILIAKNSITRDLLINLMKEGKIKKLYRCIVSGKVENKENTIKAYMLKDRNNSRVIIKNNKEGNSFEIITKYKVVRYFKDNHDNLFTEIEVQLVTGRTHQIRAHLSHIGYPIIGDSKYGLNTINRRLGLKKQFLWAYKLIIDYDSQSLLKELGSKNFEIDIYKEYDIIEKKLSPLKK